MKISELISKLDYHFNDEHGQAVTDPDRARALLDVEIQDITNDSRKIRQDCLFFCISGAQFDGHDFALQALENGAKALVVEKDLDLGEAARDAVIIRVYDSRYAMAFISAAWFGNPASRMKIIGVTGTKGKTTTTYMVRSILQSAGFKERRLQSRSDRHDRDPVRRCQDSFRQHHPRIPDPAEDL